MKQIEHDLETLIKKINACGGNGYGYRAVTLSEQERSVVLAALQVALVQERLG